mmetsp:Transcript_23016/g.54571  ORF Transcript_23016/g.54571 Transcript_23016/m.54571 type:complete len:205 (-) Transcript_23016:73-687(-)
MGGFGGCGAGGSLGHFLFGQKGHFRSRNSSLLLAQRFRCRNSSLLLFQRCRLAVGSRCSLVDVGGTFRRTSIDTKDKEIKFLAETQIFPLLDGFNVPVGRSLLGISGFVGTWFWCFLLLEGVQLLHWGCRFLHQCLTESARRARHCGRDTFVRIAHLHLQQFDLIGQTLDLGRIFGSERCIRQGLGRRRHHGRLCLCGRFAKVK